MSLSYSLQGRDEADAETVVLSAGLGGAGAFWAPQLDALGRRYRLLLYDHRGTGANAGPLPEDYTIGHMADDVLAMLDEARIARAHLVGHALGGLIGLDLAVRAPGRLGSLVLVNAWARVDSHTRRCFDMRLALLRRVGPDAYVRAQPIFLYPAAWLSRNAERVAREEAHGVAHFQGAANLERRVGALIAFDVSDRLDTITVPTLVAASRDDVLVPYTASEQLAAGIPGAALWMAPEGGHGFTVTEPDAFNQALLDFLATHPMR